MPYVVEQTELFEKWHASVKDQKAKIAIARRIERSEHGNLGMPKLLVMAYRRCELIPVRGTGFTLPSAKKSLLFY